MATGFYTKHAQNHHVHVALALAFASKQIQEFSACWNSVIRRWFDYSKREFFNAVLLGHGSLIVRYLIKQKSKVLYSCLHLSSNRLL